MNWGRGGTGMCVYPKPGDSLWGGCHVEEKKVEKGDSVLPATKDLNEDIQLNKIIFFSCSPNSQIIKLLKLDVCSLSTSIIRVN